MRRAARNAALFPLENFSLIGWIYLSQRLLKYDRVRGRSDRTMKELQQKIADYIRFGQVLLALATFLMIGLLIPNGVRETAQSFAMMGVIVLLLGLSFFFFKRVKALRDKLEENEYESN